MNSKWYFRTHSEMLRLAEENQGSPLELYYLKQATRYQKLIEHSAKIEECRVESESKVFGFFWIDGEVSIGSGHSVEFAFTKLGYGGGATSALDFYMEV